MKRAAIPPAVRDRGYELLFLLFGAASLALRPTLRHVTEVEDMIHAEKMRRAEFLRLERTGWIETTNDRTGKLLRLTVAGRRVFEGGRDPESAWNRPWDGQWRLLIFDLPRHASQARVKFWRWLRASHFGKLQGSVWVTPDPVTNLAETARETGIESTMLVLFTGGIQGDLDPRDVAAAAWDFAGLERAYQTYLGFGRRSLRQLGVRLPPAPRATEILLNERKFWWQAARHDPLLPRILLPPSYLGFQALELRKELHTALATTLGHPPAA